MKRNVCTFFTLKESIDKLNWSYYISNMLYSIYVNFPSLPTNQICCATLVRRIDLIIHRMSLEMAFL